MPKLVDRSYALARKPTPAEIRSTLRAAYDDLIEFAATDAFQTLLAEMYSLPPSDRPFFVDTIVLNEQIMRDRGIVPPEGILIQRSAFGDRRPTLFCIKKFIPEELQSHWQNANITFDNLVSDQEVPRDERAWRPPLPFELQQALTAGLIDESALEGVYQPMPVGKQGQS